MALTVKVQPHGKYMYTKGAILTVHFVAYISATELGTRASSIYSVVLFRLNSMA